MDFPQYIDFPIGINPHVGQPRNAATNITLSRENEGYESNVQYVQNVMVGESISSNMIFLVKSMTQLFEGVCNY